jgi:hypothetical protein
MNVLQQQYLPKQKTEEVHKFEQLELWGTRWCRWMRHCGTSRKFEGSILGGVIYIFRGLNLSARTMRSTQPLAQMSSRDILWEKRRPVLSSDNLATFLSRMSKNPGSFKLQACLGIAWLTRCLFRAQVSELACGFRISRLEFSMEF